MPILSIPPADLENYVESAKKHLNDIPGLPHLDYQICCTLAQTCALIAIAEGLMKLAAQEGEKQNGQ